MDRDQAISELLDREAIRELATRYCVAIDCGDWDGVAQLYVEDVNNGRLGVGRDILKKQLRDTVAMTGFNVLHMVANHQIDFSGPDEATGVCYLRSVGRGAKSWDDTAVVYFDTYAKRDGRWYFVRRRIAPLSRMSFEQPEMSVKFMLPDAWSVYREARGLPERDDDF